MGYQAHAAERRGIRFEEEIKPQSESMKCHCEDSLHDDSDGCLEDERPPSPAALFWSRGR
jgi:hypothetical protein